MTIDHPWSALVLLCHKTLKPAPDKGFSMVALEHQKRLKSAVYAGLIYFYDTVVLADPHIAGTRAIKLAEINRLPGSQQKPAILDDHLNR